MLPVRCLTHGVAPSRPNPAPIPPPSRPQPHRHARHACPRRRPTGGWGSVEYGTPLTGQGHVIGGRWKPLQYFYKRSVFQDVMASCGAAGACFVRNDQPGRPFEGSVTVSSVEFSTGVVAPLLSLTFSGPTALPPGPGVIHYFTVPLGNVTGATHILTAQCMSSESRQAAPEPLPDPWAPTAVGAVGPSHVTLESPSHVTLETPSHVTLETPSHVGPEHVTSRVISFNEIALAPPFAMRLPPASVTASAAQAANPDNSVNISLRTDRTALYVTLTTLAAGRFTDNAFALTADAVVRFVPFGGGAADLPLLRSSLRVEHLQEHL